MIVPGPTGRFYIIMCTEATELSWREEASDCKKVDFVRIRAILHASSKHLCTYTYVLLSVRPILPSFGETSDKSAYA